MEADIKRRIQGVADTCHVTCINTNRFVGVRVLRLLALAGFMRDIVIF